MRSLVLLLPLVLTACLGDQAGPSHSSAPVGTAAASPLPVPVALPWPHAADCRSLAAAVLAMPAEDRQHLAAASSPFSIDTSLPVTADLPVRTQGVGRCRLVVGAVHKLAAPAAQPVAHRIVRSEYSAGTRRTKNARWDALDDVEKDLNREDQGSRILATGDPSLDLIGLVAGTVLGGIDRLRHTQDKSALDQERATTDRYLETEHWQPYTYDVTTMEVSRAAVVDVTLQDPDRPTLNARPLIREQRRLDIAKGRSSRDRALLEGQGEQAATKDDLALFRAQPPSPSVSGLLQALLAGETAAVPLEPAAGPEKIESGSSVGETVGPDGVRRFSLRPSAPDPGGVKEPVVDRDGP